MEQEPLCRAHLMRNTLTELRAALTTEIHKRDYEDFLANSSDPPMFSSDPPIFSTSIDDYQQPSRKRQHKGPWYEMEEDKELGMKTRRRHGLQRAHHQRRPFRKFDSGVYMGSDESLPSELSEPFSDEAPCFITKSGAADAVLDGDVEDLEPNQGREQLLVEPDALFEDSLIDKATQTVEDPGDFAGPVFPYWQQQPEGLRHFHIAQKIAQEKVLDCVDRGEEVVDLS